MTGASRMAAMMLSLREAAGHDRLLMAESRPSREAPQRTVTGEDVGSRVTKWFKFVVAHRPLRGAGEDRGGGLQGQRLTDAICVHRLHKPATGRGPTPAKEPCSTIDR